MSNILLVIDVQNGFQRNDETRENAGKIASLINSEIFDKVIATKFVNRPESPYYQWLHWPRLLDEPDIELLDELKEKSSYILEKNYYNCERNSLIETLRECGGGTLPECVFVCGTDTDCCVQINATTLFELGIHPIVLVDYCSSNGGPESHKAGLTVMRRTLGKKHLISGKVCSKEEIKNICAKVVE